jgi:hypothetical protein
MPPESCLGRCFSNPLRPTRAADADGLVVQLGEQLHVLLHVAPREEGGVLEDVADAVGADVDGAAAGGLESGGDAQQRRFAAAGGSDDGEELAGAHGEVDTVEGDGAVGELHLDVGERHEIPGLREGGGAGGRCDRGHDGLAFARGVATPRLRGEC